MGDFFGGTKMVLSPVDANLRSSSINVDKILSITVLFHDFLKIFPSSE